MDMIQCSLQCVHHLAVYGIWGDLLDDINLLNLNLIVAPCIFVESLQFINQRMHI